MDDNRRRYKQVGRGQDGRCECSWCGATAQTDSKEDIAAFLRIHPHRCSQAAEQKGLGVMLREHPDKRVHFEDPDDEAAEGAVCGASLEAVGHPAQFSAGPRSTYRPELVTCPACRLRIPAGQQKGLGEG